MFKRILYLLLLIMLFKQKSNAQDNVQLKDSLIYYYKQGNYRKALAFSNKLVELCRKPPVNDSTLATNLNDMALLYQKVGDWKQSESFYNESLELNKKAHGVHHAEYAAALLNLASLYKEKGEYAKARPMLENVIAIYKETTGENTDAYAIAINNLSTLLIKTGDFARSEELQLQALAIRRNKKGEQSIEVAQSYNNLGALYYEVNNAAKAVTYYKQAITIYTKIYGDSSLNTAFIKDNLATAYGNMHQYEECEVILKQTHEIFKKQLGENHPYYAAHLNEVASLYQAMKRYTEAEVLFTQAMEIRKRILGEKHPDYALSLNNLGGLYYQEGAYDKAASFFTQALQVINNIKGKENIEYCNALINLGNLHHFLQRPDTAAIFYEQDILPERKMLSNNLYFLSETELLAYLQKRNAIYSSLYAPLSAGAPSSLTDKLYNFHLMLNGVAMRNAKLLSSAMEHAKDSSETVAWLKYKNEKALLGRTFSLPISKRTLNTDSLAAVVNDREKELLRISNTFREAQQLLTADWREIQKQLKKGEVSIDFVHFNKLGKNTTDTIVYGAFILRKEDSIPVFVHLFEEHSFKKVLNSFAYNSANGARGLNGGSITGKHNGGAAMYQLLWKPLEKYLANATTIYLTADGLLHQLSFAAIPTGKDSLLNDRLQLIQLTSAAQLINRPVSEKEKLQSVTLFGGINYNEASAGKEDAMAANPYAYIYQQNRGPAIDSFKYLPATLQEIQGISQAVSLKGRQAIIYKGTQASEKAFRSLQGLHSPQVLHFATHGFTIPDPVQRSTFDKTGFKISSEPLMRTGLVLSGGNKGWLGKANPNDDDGILTGFEVSAVPLQGTSLVVLSACETATGELKGNEGVFGLQRAFKISGANYIMAALWQVPDKETQEFMTTFYNKWLLTDNIQNAFLLTQKAMRKQYPPYYWAAFTLVH